MRLSRSKRVVLLATALLTLGIAGPATAEPTHPARRAAAAPEFSGSIKAPAKPAGTPATKPATKPAKPAKPGAPAKVKHTGGPAGSHMTTGGKGVALTFDDGPDPAQTPKILQLLAKQHVHATFCLVGRNVEKHPDLVRQIVAGGHTLCNHTWKHDLKLGKKPDAKIRADLQHTNAAIQKAAPGAKVKYYRAPGGNFTPAMVSIAKDLGMTSIYWKVDPRDWDHPKGESDGAHRTKVIHAIQKRTRPGSIVLSHDYAQPDTIDAYRTLIPWLRHRYQLVGLP